MTDPTWDAFHASENDDTVFDPVEYGDFCDYLEHDLEVGDDDDG